MKCNKLAFKIPLDNFITYSCKIIILTECFFFTIATFLSRNKIKKPSALLHTVIILVIFYSRSDEYYFAWMAIIIFIKKIHYQKPIPDRSDRSNRVFWVCWSVFFWNKYNIMMAILVFILFRIWCLIRIWHQISKKNI
jgi:hypothetical protein